MANQKITRHNHPLMVNARKESYMAGRADGYKEGYQKGYEEKCADIHKYYRIIISAFEVREGMAKKRIEMLEKRRKK